MVYCEQDMCESKLGRLMQAFRADRPSEWQMDEFISMTEDMHKMNKELLAALECSEGFVCEVSEKTGFGQFHTLKVIRSAIAKAKAAS